MENSDLSVGRGPWFEKVYFDLALYDYVIIYYPNSFKGVCPDLRPRGQVQAVLADWSDHASGSQLPATQGAPD